MPLSTLVLVFSINDYSLHKCTEGSFIGKKRNSINEKWRKEEGMREKRKEKL